MEIKGRILAHGAVKKRIMGIDDGVIAYIKDYDGPEELPIIIPGFFDVHTHGGNMIDVNHINDVKQVEELSMFFASKGVTSFLLSVMTDEISRMEEVVLILKQAIVNGLPGASLRGIHLEGPFLAPEYKGAMPESLLKAGDIALFDHFQGISGNNVRYMTVAPELEGMLEMIRHIRKKGICRVSMGHSAAEYEKSVEAIEAGVVSSTHTFNAMKLFHMHRPAISGAALESDDVYCEVIADGFHLHPATVRLILKTKGFEKVVAITDSIMAAGLPDGKYKLGVNDVVVKDGDAKLLDGVRAGSTLTMDKAFRNLLKFTREDMSKLSLLVSANPARMLGFGDTGLLEVGKRADFIVLSPLNEIESTYVRGIEVYKKGGV